MKKTLVFAVLLLSPLLLSASESANIRHTAPAEQNTENSSKELHKGSANWEQVGESIKETSGKTWQATKHTSREVWQTTAEISSEAWEASKRGSSKAWQVTKKTSSEAWEATKEGTVKAWNATKHAVSDK